MSAGSTEGARPPAAPTAEQAALRALPSVERLLGTEPLRSAAEELPRAIVLAAAREAIERRRGLLLSGEPVDTGAPELAAEAATVATRRARPSLRPVINATGIVVHTNLGRAPLAPEALAAVAATAGGYSNLEYDLDEGARGNRHRHAEDLLRELTGAEAAMAVNNNAAAVLLAVAATAAGREVVISRGQLVEIGGSFRIPDIVAQSGARLVEVGTTNRTRLRDYRRAVNEETGALMRVHQSNFRTVGFTEEVEIEAICMLGQEVGVPVIDDIGSGLLEAGPPAEPDARRSVAAGASVVCFSGDKLLGGPQAGIAVGRSDAIERMRAHPLARAMRIDKLSLAALEATLRLHLGSGDIPVVRMLAADDCELEDRARRLSGLLSSAGVETEVIRAPGFAGGGSLPEEQLPGWAVRVSPATGAETLQERLRAGEPALIAPVRDGALLLHVRTLPDDQLETVAETVRAAIRT
jgi:L-seryl-tRNA(Ser) seleniumtransferase